MDDNACVKILDSYGLEEMLQAAETVVAANRVSLIGLLCTRVVKCTGTLASRAIDGSASSEAIVKKIMHCQILEFWIPLFSVNKLIQLEVEDFQVEEILNLIIP